MEFDRASVWLNLSLTLRVERGVVKDVTESIKRLQSDAASRLTARRGSEEVKKASMRGKICSQHLLGLKRVKPVGNSALSVRVLLPPDPLFPLHHQTW